MAHGRELVAIRPAYTPARLLERPVREVPRDIVDDTPAPGQRLTGTR